MHNYVYPALPRQVYMASNEFIAISVFKIFTNSLYVPRVVNTYECWGPFQTNCRFFSFPNWKHAPSLPEFISVHGYNFNLFRMFHGAPPLYCHLKISTLHACLCEQLCDVNPRGLSRIKKQLKIRHSKRSFSLPVNRPKFAVAVFYDCSDGASSPIFCWDNIYTTFIIPILCDVIILYYTYNMQQP